MKRIATALALAALAAGCGVSAPERPAAAPTPAPVTSKTPRSTPTARPELRGQGGHEVAKPTRVMIPSIGVDAKLVPLGDEKPGVMEVPDFGRAGWYAKQPAVRPGAPGPGVIAAHYDSRKGPDVFYRLGQLRKGAEITVVDAEGDEHDFVVERMVTSPKGQLPAKEVFSRTSDPTLRLITCGGAFDRKWGHYLDNVTVFAKAA